MRAPMALTFPAYAGLKTWPERGWISAAEVLRGCGLALLADAASWRRLIGIYAPDDVTGA